MNKHFYHHHFDIVNVACLMKTVFDVCLEHININVTTLSVSKLYRKMEPLRKGCKYCRLGLIDLVHEKKWFNCRYDQLLSYIIIAFLASLYSCPLQYS